VQGIGIHKYKDLINFIPTVTLTVPVITKTNQKNNVAEVQIIGKSSMSKRWSSAKAENAWSLLVRYRTDGTGLVSGQMDSRILKINESV
jgi:hypothetical protein